MREDFWGLIVQGMWETVYMVLISGIISSVLGSLLGVLLVVTDKNGIHPVTWFHKIANIIINLVRSIPEIVLIIILLPVARFIVGTGLGNEAAIVSISIGMAPMIARTVENSLLEVNGGKVEAALSMGANTFQIITKILIPEALPSILHGMTLSTICVIAYTAIAGDVGAGGLGALAIQYGYKRFQTDIMIATVIILVIIVQIIQFLGDYWARKINQKIGRGE